MLEGALNYDYLYAVLISGVSICNGHCRIPKKNYYAFNFKSFILQLTSALTIVYLLGNAAAQGQRNLPVARLPSPIYCARHYINILSKFRKSSTSGKGISDLLRERTGIGVSFSSLQSLHNAHTSVTELDCSLPFPGYQLSSYPVLLPLRSFLINAFTLFLLRSDRTRWKINPREVTIPGP